MAWKKDVMNPPPLRNEHRAHSLNMAVVLPPLSSVRCAGGSGGARGAWCLVLLTPPKTVARAREADCTPACRCRVRALHKMALGCDWQPPRAPEGETSVAGGSRDATSKTKEEGYAFVKHESFGNGALQCRPGGSYCNVVC